MKLIKVAISVFITLIIIFFIKEFIAYKVIMPFDYEFIIK